MAAAKRARAIACSFCGKESTAVRHLIAGPGVWICDECVRVCHQILEDLDRQAAARPDAAAQPGDEERPDDDATKAGAPPDVGDPSPEPDAVMARILQAQQAALSGERPEAGASFARIWDEIGPDGDPLHRVTLAHYMADVQEDPHGELDWDLRALAAADSLTGERARQYHATLAVRGFYASLHLNLAADYEKLGQVRDARRHLALAEAATPDLPDGGYGDLIRSGIAAARHRLGG